MKEKKNVNIAVMLLVLACFSMAVAGLAQLYAARKAGDQAQAHLSESEARNQLLLSVVALDLDANYPETPEAVLDLYDDTTRLLYSGLLTEPDVAESVLKKQRQLCAPELLELNAFEDQYAEFMASAQEADKKSIRIADIEHVDLYYDRNDPDLCVINSIMRLSGESDLYFNYYLKKGEDGRWKIILRDYVNRMFERPPQ